ncbi:hypothetical protein PsorP6_001035 [Peronosclerospora sorghi]|uniref:Uncharacterized protein n=1 Tax=Peronosclerospora sorghi TaxID=230839 RepID=A0ACC0WPZ5_9STRA|nr:hypothetical protein PsorP6_001035 [Peronosclerospora sorghi]
MSELKQSVQQVLDLIKNSASVGSASDTERRMQEVRKLRKGHPKGRCATSTPFVAQIATAAEDSTFSERKEPEGASVDAVSEEETTGGPAQGTSGDVGPEHNLAEDVAKEFEVQDDYDDYDEYHPDHQGVYDTDQQYSLENIMPSPRGAWPFPLMKEEWLTMICQERTSIMWRRVFFTNGMATEDFIFLNGHSYTIERRQHLQGVITEGGLSGMYADENEVAWYNHMLEGATLYEVPPSPEATLLNVSYDKDENPEKVYTRRTHP